MGCISPESTDVFVLRGDSLGQAPAANLSSGCLQVAPPPNPAGNVGSIAIGNVRCSFLQLFPGSPSHSPATWMAPGSFSRVL